MTGLAGFNQQSFLRDHWQRKPLLIRSALPFEDPLSPEELAGIALEDGVEARIIRRTSDSWMLDAGPVAEDSFDGDTPWTLLVQAVDQRVPEVAELRKLVDFLPRWRLDDIMVSYATEGGGVGPHYDNYDVFLLQGMGQRRWQLGQACDADSPLEDIPGLRILSEFDAREDFLLEPGDILYVPPGIAHWGTAVGPCMTYSIGFRAPRLNDLLSRLTDSVLERLDPEMFYRDPEQIACEPGEISSPAIESAREQLDHAIASLALEPDWFGELVTEPRSAPVLPEPGSPLPAMVRADPAGRVAWRRRDEGLTVYGNGDAFPAPAGCRGLVSELCAGQRIGTDGLDDGSRNLLLALWHNGCLIDE